MIETYEDAKGGIKKRTVSEAGMKQGYMDKVTEAGYEGIQDKVYKSLPDIHLDVLTIFSVGCSI